MALEKEKGTPAEEINMFEKYWGTATPKNKTDRFLQRYILSKG